jgi:hypothetical protein
VTGSRSAIVSGGKGVEDAPERGQRTRPIPPMTRPSAPADGNLEPVPADVNLVREVLAAAGLSGSVAALRQELAHQRR